MSGLIVPEPLKPSPVPVTWPRARLVGCALLLAVLALLAGLGVEHRPLPALGEFVGRFHVVVLHFPIGLIALALVLETGRIPRVGRLLPQATSGVITFVLGLGALTASVAAVCGWLLAVSGGYTPELIALHFYGGMATAAGALVAFMLRLVGTARPGIVIRWLGLAFLLVTNLVLLTTGHLGGVITHGETYLTEHAPALLRRALGLPGHPADGGPSGASRVDQPAFSSVILPFLEAKCVECHNPQKPKGTLRMEAYAELMKGGSSGPAVVPGQPAASELLRRLALPDDDDDHMPPKGKPPATADEVALLTWWIQAGAPERTSVNALAPPAPIREILARRPRAGP